MSDKELYSGMIRLHILYHASKGPIFGLWIIEELGRHGYKLSPGTLYPILHGLASTIAVLTILPLTFAVVQRRASLESASVHPDDLAGETSKKF